MQKLHSFDGGVNKLFVSTNRYFLVYALFAEKCLYDSKGDYYSSVQAVQVSPDAKCLTLGLSRRRKRSGAAAGGGRLQADVRPGAGQGFGSSVTGSAVLGLYWGAGGAGRRRDRGVCGRQGVPRMEVPSTGPL